MELAGNRHLATFTQASPLDFQLHVIGRAAIQSEDGDRREAFGDVLELYARHEK